MISCGMCGEEGLFGKHELSGSKIVLLEDDEIVHEFELNELTQTFVLEKPSGYISLRIAGESADFQLDYHTL